jgi:hypothetical protein
MRVSVCALHLPVSFRRITFLCQCFFIRIIAPYYPQIQFPVKREPQTCQEIGAVKDALNADCFNTLSGFPVLQIFRRIAYAEKTSLNRRESP